MTAVTNESAHTRLILLDILRGFAVLGIFFVNIPDMVGNGLAFRSSFTGADALLRLFYDMFFQTKLYTIFSFLFGAGFTIFMQNAERKGLPARRLFLRRLLVLLVIGLLHGVLLWFGDILTSYALLGLLLFPFYRRSIATLIVWSLILLGLFTLLILFLYAWSPFGAASPRTFTQIPALQQRLDYLLNIGLLNNLIFSFEVVGLYLVGIVAAKKQWFSGSFHVTAVRSLQFAALVVSVLLFIPMVQYYISSPVYNTFAVYHFTYLSGKSMAIFYICTLVLAARRWGSERFRGLAAVGRLSLTVYLLQSIITAGFVAGFGQRISQAPLWLEMIYAVIMTVLFIVGSKAWLKRYRMGPAEWLWRAGTYGFVPALRRSEERSMSKPMSL
ncbi:DUF418 domain-containing protein [Paenibacillus allorhizosphaerae]|uniref:DUF418 domain-containing protein n=1 Tax=Paenibacillus allorhizosphaerae TaxID=2849866 RepID=A0ABM8VAA2_9BACL|nr:DUF418 domain-containing protein [Paenibacillus allorhizosphaerae]CAG7615740.1 hypothetical protein PAECIP111802_00206 [Paenibacillus allorhizosphaerae]